MLVRLSIVAVLCIGLAALAFGGADTFTGAEDHTISLQEASSMAANYQEANATAVKSHFFGRQAIEKILAQDGAVGVRIYYGLDNSGQQHLIMVGTDANQNDQVKGSLAEMAPPCPPFCGSDNELNGNAKETPGEIAANN